MVEVAVSIVMPNDMEMDDLIAAMKRLLKTSARMYMHLCAVTVDRFGREGEMTVRYGLRAYGHWRGIEMREAHHAMGLEINMKNLIGCWDNASTYIVKDRMEEEGSYEPFDTRFDVHYCPAAEAWTEAGFFQWGHVYCDEFHQACASTYHPDGSVVIPQNLMKGDDHCHFRWVMPPNAQALNLGEPSELGLTLARDYTATTDLEAAWRSLKRSNRLVGGRFYTAAKVVLERHGEQGRAAVLEALKRWGGERGKFLRQEHEASGIEPSLESFVRHHDLPARFVWHTEVTIEPGRVILDVHETPHDQAWSDLQAQEYATLWYEGSYPAMAEAYLPGARAAWTKLRSKGDATNRLELQLH
jgi:hypothetical protein